MRALYAENDLYSNNNLVGIVDEQGKRIFKKGLPNDPQTVLEVLRPFKEEMVAIAVTPKNASRITCGVATERTSVLKRFPG